MVSFDYPYMAAGRRAPDRLPVLVETHRTVLSEARKGHRGPVILIGKSMGGRVGCHVALEDRVDGLVCLGYPLKGMGKSGQLRDEVLLALETPVLFVQGTRDNLCPLDLLSDVRRKMRCKTQLYEVESGNHSLLATKGHLRTTGRTQDDIDGEILGTIDSFTRAL